MTSRPLLHTHLALLGLLAGSACASSSSDVQSAAPPPPPRLDRLSREAFNARAVYLGLPIFWLADTGGEGRLDPGELVTVTGAKDAELQIWVAGGGFTPKLTQTYETLVATTTVAAAPEKLEGEALRRALVQKELAQSRQTVIAHDFKGGTAEDRALAKRMAKVAELIEQLHMQQAGSWPFREEIPLDDPASQLLFFRNQGPWCVAPATLGEKDCSAVPSKPARKVGVYPASLQVEAPKFCEVLTSKLGALADDHFSVVVEEGDKLVTVPYSKAYAPQLAAMAAELEAAAKEVQSPEEGPLREYLMAAAQACRDNDWTKADEAWVKMGALNSKWYLRVGPDEVYWEPCALRAGFHLSFGLIDKRSLEWQQKLDPLKDEMEKELAKLAGPPYRARAVSFKLPDFTEIVLNAGDSRTPSGATIGQSLPNWGKVREEGRGRTVAMTNFYTDDDSIRAMSSLVSSLLCKATMATYTPEPGAGIMSTVLHEAAHNLGPAAEYRVGGKTAEAALGGQLASMMEELKAQSAALYFTDWLAQKGVIDSTFAGQAHTRDLTWAFGHISRGMYDGDKGIKAYSQLAMVQVGFLVKEKVLTFKAEELATNGIDRGCFELDLAKFPAAAKKLMTNVGQLTARLDKKGSEGLRRQFVDDKGTFAELRQVITDRMLRQPKPSFVYSVRY